MADKFSVICFVMGSALALMPALSLFSMMSKVNVLPGKLILWTTWNSTSLILRCYLLLSTVTMELATSFE